MISLNLLTADEARARVHAQPWHTRLWAMYSSQWDGIVTDPLAMTIPADDHVAHRGDGVFETIKVVDGAVYALRPHLDRLEKSAGGIRIDMPWGPDELERAVVATARAAGRREGLLRVIVSRGPGGFGVDPRESPAPGLYIMAYEGAPPFMHTHPSGARAATVSQPIKAGKLATLKTCNYLPNALMKLEAGEAGADFPIAFDERGCVAEGATENVGIVDGDGRLCVPREGRMLAGITMQRALALSIGLVKRGLISGTEARDIPREELFHAREVLVFGTTPEVTAVTSLDGKTVGFGRPGPVQQALARMVDADQRTNAALRTPVV
ncbi:MAG: aminotransferase class IV [Kiritimatiellae bacterium]|nr:aminotransferase class IV [Kiritimatiellia bacterium]